MIYWIKDHGQITEQTILKKEYSYLNELGHLNELSDIFSVFEEILKNYQLSYSFFKILNKYLKVLSKIIER